MIYRPEEISETIRMVEAEHLDIRTVTMGICMLGCPGKDPKTVSKYIYDMVVSHAGGLVDAAAEVENMYGIPIVNKRVSVTPMALVLEGAPRESYLAAAEALERAAVECRIDYIAGFSALVQKGATSGSAMLMRCLPDVLASTTRVCCSVNLASSRTGINLEATAMMGEVMSETAAKTKHGAGCARLVVFANAPEDNPFIAGAMHGVGEPDVVINVGVSGPGVVLAAIERQKRLEPGLMDCQSLSEVIKRTAFKITRAGELIGREVVARLGPPVRFGVLDLSLAPTPAEGDSVGRIIEAMGIERVGAHGTTAALYLLTEAVKKGGVMASSSVGGLSGAFIPISEDAGMVDATRLGAMTLDKLEAMTAICSVGMDMVALPGDTPPSTIAAIIADELAIGVINHKTTACRLIPIPGSKPGDTVDLGGLLGELIVMDTKKFDVSTFIARGGRIPAPMNSLRN
ncbi:MAG TPA: PFL family protein [Myxococcota bacterium]|nr:PFL family protein [Myxococcota bacterium]HPB50742.1 PFL family protein [Myxococcota bacterium]HQP94648.1 PFL family protein [Myxococcota bacterium]